VIGDGPTSPPTARQLEVHAFMVVEFLDPRLPDRFWSKCMPEPNSGCWLWLGAVGSSGAVKYRIDAIV
jgi:hypothetical protein